MISLESTSRWTWRLTRIVWLSFRHLSETQHRVSPSIIIRRSQCTNSETSHINRGDVNSECVWIPPPSRQEEEEDTECFQIQFHLLHELVVRTTLLKYLESRATPLLFCISTTSSHQRHTTRALDRTSILSCTLCCWTEHFWSSLRNLFRHSKWNSILLRELWRHF